MTVLAPHEEKKILSLLLPLLPAVDSQKVESYLKTLEKLKKWSDRINKRNKTYIQEFLS